MVGGPLGITLAPYIYRRPALLKALTPFAQAYINWSGYRKIGLRYDDLRKHMPLTEIIVLISHTAPFTLQLLKNVQMFRGCVISAIMAVHDVAVDGVGQQAIQRLTPEETYDRSFRIRRAFQADLMRRQLPKDQWTKPEEVSHRPR